MISVDNVPPGGYSGTVVMALSLAVLRGHSGLSCPLPTMQSASAVHPPLPSTPPSRNLGDRELEAQIFPHWTRSCLQGEPKLSPGEDPKGSSCWQGAWVPTRRGAVLPSSFRLS